MVKVLITGFKHSGTTLMLQLLNAHPQVARIENEKGYIEYDRPPPWIKMMVSKNCPNPKGYVCGDKLPWETRSVDLKAKRAIDFSYKWLNLYGQNARILCMLRHPIDVALSKYPLKQLQDSIQKDETMYHYCINSVPMYLSWARSYPRCGVVVYEELLKHPDIFLSRIFDYLKISSDKKTIAKILKSCPINSSRAYAFMAKGFDDSYDYERLIEMAGDNKL